MTADAPPPPRPMDALEKIDRWLKVWAVIGPLMFGIGGWGGGWLISDARAQAKTGVDVADLLRRVGNLEGDVGKVREELYKVRTETLMQVLVQLQDRKSQADSLDLLVRKELLRRSEPTINAAGVK